MVPMHTHFGSATHGLASFLSVLIFGTAWRMGWMHALLVPNKHVQGLARAALSQF